MFKLFNFCLFYFIFLQFSEQRTHKKNNTKHNYSINQFQLKNKYLNKTKSINQKIGTIKSDYGQSKVFLQPNQKYILTPVLLFDSQNSFKKQYRLEVKQNSTLDQKLSDFYEIHPALQKLSTYNLTTVKQLNVTDCSLVEIYFSLIDIPYLMCLTKSNIFQVFIIEQFKISLQYSFVINYSWTEMNIISETQMIFYNASFMQYYSYDVDTANVTLVQISVNQRFLIEECETYVQDIVQGNIIKMKTKNNQNHSFKDRQNYNFTQKSILYQVCTTNNNKININKNNITFSKDDQYDKDFEFRKMQEQSNIPLKKDFVLLFLVSTIQIKLIGSFQIAQKNAQSLNHIIGLEVIDTLEKVIMFCYNLYNMTQFYQIQGQPSRFSLKNSSFVASFCSIYKIYLQNSKMNLIDRMQLQSTPYPLLQTSLQIKVVLAVATQVSITFYHLDVIKQMFQYIQTVQVPQNQNFNCYEFSYLTNSIDSVSLTCAYDSQDSKKLSFVMVYDKDLQLFIPVGYIFVQSKFFHTNQLIYALSTKQLNVLQANEQYFTINYSPLKTQITVFEIQMDKPQNQSNFAVIVFYPAEHNKVYVNQELPYFYEIEYDVQDQIDLKNSFQGSNILFLKVEVSNLIDEGKQKQSTENSFKEKIIKDDRIYSYQYSLLLSIYIKQHCVRVIKFTDDSFYRILQIQKSRADQVKDIQNDFGAEQYYYYTQICTKYQGSYICGLQQINGPPNITDQEAPTFKNSQAEHIRVQSDKNSRLLGIQYIRQEQTFAYLYELTNQNQAQHGIMFLSLTEDGDRENSNKHCYELNSFLNQIFAAAQSKFNPQLSIQKIQLNSLTLKNDFLIVEYQIKSLQIKTFCLTTSIKKYVLQQSQADSGLKLDSFCYFTNSIKGESFSKFHIQQDKLIISQTQYDIKNLQKVKQITVFNVDDKVFMKKQGSYKLVASFKDNNLSIQELISNEIQFVGLYRQYIIILNETTLSKYHMGAGLQLIYQYVFNPERPSSKVHHSSQTDEQKRSETKNQHINENNNINIAQNKLVSSPTEIKYVLFLQKYLIIQFQLFYQLYNIGEQLISIQIATNNFNEYLQHLSPQQKLMFKGANLQGFNLNEHNLKNPQAMGNIIIKDAFLVQGDNIVIIEQNHLVVAKYITNPKLEFGPFQLSNVAVQKDYTIKLTPVGNFYSQQNQLSQIQQQTNQSIDIKILYSHYLVEKVAKNIKTLIVPSVTHNFQLQIWTNVFRGPVLQYYLSDTFNNQIVLRQHIDEVTNYLGQHKQKQTNEEQKKFVIIQHHNAFLSKYQIKNNLTHLSIFEDNKNEMSYFELPDELKTQFFLRFLTFQLTNNKKQLISFLTTNYIVFIQKIAATQIIKQDQTSIKFNLVQLIKHNISTYQDIYTPISQKCQMQLLIDKKIQQLYQYNSGQAKPLFQSSFSSSKNQKNKNYGQQESFYLAIWIEQQDQNNSLRIVSKNNLHIYQFLYSNNNLSFNNHERVKVSEEISQLKSVQKYDGQVEYRDTLFLLTYTENLLIYQLKSPNSDNSQMIQLKQTVNLKDQIPKDYRSNHHSYQSFEIFTLAAKQKAKNPQELSKNQKQAQNFTMLLFSFEDQSYHVQLEISKKVNSDQYQFELKNIYSGYQNFCFKKVVSISLSNESSLKSKESQNSLQPQTFTPSYWYFVLEYEFENSQRSYLVYYGYNYNFSDNGQVGYFKCGEQISIQENEFQHNQNSQDIMQNQKQILQNSQEIALDSQVNQVSPIKNRGFEISNTQNEFNSQITTYHFYSLRSSKITVQQIRINIQNASESESAYNVEILLFKQFAVNKTITMILNYKKPPIVTYIQFNAKNFDTIANIYTKFIFITDQITWTGFYIGMPVIILSFVAFAILLKRCQVKENLSSASRLKHQSQNQHIIINSSTSRSKSSKEQRIIQIEQQNSDEGSSNNQDSSQCYSPRFEYVAPDKFISPKKYRNQIKFIGGKSSSLLQSPFKSNYPDDISQSEIQEIPEIKLETMDQQHEEMKQEKQILQFLINKRGSFASNRSSFN